MVETANDVGRCDEWLVGLGEETGDDRFQKVWTESIEMIERYHYVLVPLRVEGRGDQVCKGLWFDRTSLTQFVQVCLEGHQLGTTIQK